MKRVLFALMLCASVTHAGVFKWVDAQGKVQYGDQPPDQAASKQLKTDVNTVPAQAAGAIDASFMIGRWRAEASVSFGTQIPAQTYVFTATSQGVEGRSGSLQIKSYEVKGNTITVTGGVQQVYTVIDRNTVNYPNIGGKGMLTLRRQ